MKACIVLQNQYAKMGHAMARVLKEEHGVDQFCAYVFSPGAAELVRHEQSDIVYDPILVDHELHATYADTVLDLEYIRTFEATYSPPNLWQYLYVDRKLMMSIGPKEETTTVIDPLYDRDDLLKTFQVRAKAIEAMLEKERPDVILFFAIGTLGHMILFHVAKKLGIKTLNIDFPRIRNLIALSKDYRTLTEAEKTFAQFQKNNDDTRAHAEARELVEQFKKTGSLGMQYMEMALEQTHDPKKGWHPSHLLRSLTYLATLTKNYLRYGKLFLYGETVKHPRLFIWHKLLQRARLVRKNTDLYGTVRFDEPYVYVPLHYEPELAILLLSPFYFNQIELIRYIARSVPLDYMVYVKEHPAMRGKRKRSFYNILKKIPNVVLVPPDTSGFELTKHAKIVATISGTPGWEACLLGVPVVTFGNVFYNALSFVERVHDIETLPDVINRQLTQYTHDRHELIHFLAAVLKESVPLDFNRLWYENDINVLVANEGIRAFVAYALKLIRDEQSD